MIKDVMDVYLLCDNLSYWHHLGKYNPRTSCQPQMTLRSIDIFNMNFIKTFGICILLSLIIPWLKRSKIKMCIFLSFLKHCLHIFYHETIHRFMLSNFTLKISIKILHCTIFLFKLKLVQYFHSNYNFYNVFIQIVTCTIFSFK